MTYVHPRKLGKQPLPVEVSIWQIADWAARSLSVDKKPPDEMDQLRSEIHVGREIGHECRQ